MTQLTELLTALSWMCNGGPSGVSPGVLAKITAASPGIGPLYGMISNLLVKANAVPLQGVAQIIIDLKRGEG